MTDQHHSLGAFCRKTMSELDSVASGRDFSPRLDSATVVSELGYNSNDLGSLDSSDERARDDAEGFFSGGDERLCDVAHALATGRRQGSVAVDTTGGAFFGGTV